MNLTRDEILTMPAGREMDTLVAEHVMGQTDFTHLEQKYFEGATEDGTDGWDGWYCPRCMNYHEKCVKNYSTHLDYAWEVVEKLKSMGINVELNIYIGDGYSCYLGKEVPNMAGLQEIAESAHAPSMSLAICRAALLTVIEI